MNDTLKDYLKSLNDDQWSHVEELDNILNGIDRDIDHNSDQE